MKFAVSILILALAGCGTSPDIQHTDRTAPLIAHPQFKSAVQVAPDLMRATLTTITDLEAQLEAAQLKAK